MGAGVGTTKGMCKKCVLIYAPKLVEIVPEMGWSQNRRAYAVLGATPWGERGGKGSTQTRCPQNVGGVIADKALE